MSLFMLLDSRLRQSLGLDSDEFSSCFATGAALSPFIFDHWSRERHSCQVRARVQRSNTAVPGKNRGREIMSRVVRERGPRTRLTVMPSS